jgi:signal transduction histidine kinase
MKSTIAAQESERNAIGEELQNNFNQILSSVKLYLEVAMSNSREYFPLVEKSHVQICNLIKEVRYLSSKLIAPDEQLLELGEMITQIANDISRDTGIEFKLDLDLYHSHVVTPEQRLDIYRIIQEQFNNIVKHSNATEVYLKLGHVGNSIFLHIEDNGRGADLSRDHNGLGLKNMHGRIELYNGQLSIKSAPGKGFILKVNMDPVN